MSDGGVLTRLTAKIRALLPGNWRGRAGERFRSTMSAISEFAVDNQVKPADLAQEAVTLGRRKVEGLANKEYASALRDFADAEQKNVETELHKRSLESRLRKEDAEADLAEAEANLKWTNALEAQLELLKKLKEVGVIPRSDEHGNLTILPYPKGLNLIELAKEGLLTSGKLTEELDKPFLMPIEQFFSIDQVGTIVQGRIKSGRVTVGDEVEIVGLKDTRRTIVTDILFCKEAAVPDSAQLLLDGIAKDSLEIGMVIAKPGSIKS